MKKIFPIYLRVPVIFFSVFCLLECLIDSGDRPAFLKYPMVSLFLFIFLFLLIAFEICLEAINNIKFQLMNEEQKKKALLEDENWFPTLIKKLTKAEPIENEAQLLLDHDYDGIKELDNNLPPWWIYLFYTCILFAFIYLLRFEVFGGDNQETELKKEMENAKIEVAEYMKNAPDLTDETNVTLLTDAPSLTEGKTIFTENCAACHRADGGGQIGPNLTDNHWIFGGGIKQVFHTINNGGRDGKGMIAWKGNLKPKEIQKVASYVLSLKNSNPLNPKAPEGEVWDEKTAETPPVAEVKK